jgi:hypothetical protein
MLAKYPDPEDWRRVRFSDEVHFSFGPQGRVYILRRLGERDCPDCIQEVEKKTRKRKRKEEPEEPEDVDYKLYAWAAVGYDFKSELVFYDAGNSNGKMIHKVYIEQILEPIVKPWIIARHDFVLEEDGDSGHGYGTNTNPVKTWKAINGCESYKNNAGSPDFSPAENAWQPLKAHIRKHPHFDIKTLKELALEAWHNEKQESINNWCDSMPQRLRDCIESDGRMTRW